MYDIAEYRDKLVNVRDEFRSRATGHAMEYNLHHREYNLLRCAEWTHKADGIGIAISILEGDGGS